MRNALRSFRFTGIYTEKKIRLYIYSQQISLVNFISIGRFSFECRRTKRKAIKMSLLSGFTSN